MRKYYFQGACNEKSIGFFRDKFQMIDFYVPKEKWSDFDDCFTVISIHHLYQMKIYD